MTKPLGYYTGGVVGTDDADILSQLETVFGSQLQSLSYDDRAACIIMLVESATNTPQVFVGENFHPEGNGYRLWQLAQHLSDTSKFNLCVALLDQIVEVMRCE